MEFGKPRKNATGISPLAISRTDSTIVYNFMLNSGLVFEPSGSSLSSGINLLPEERNAYITYMNEDTNGDGESDYLSAMRDLISNPDFLQLGQKYDARGNQTGRKEQLSQLAGLRSEFRSKAESKLLNDPEHIRLRDRHYRQLTTLQEVGNERNLTAGCNRWQALT